MDIKNIDEEVDVSVEDGHVVVRLAGRNATMNRDQATYLAKQLDRAIRAVS